MSAATILPGFTLHRGWASDRYLSEVIDKIEWRQGSVRMFGRQVDEPRLTAWMGDGAYTYSGKRHEPAAMPAIVAELRSLVENAVGARFSSVLANLYRGGADSVSWHADDEPELGPEPVIASLSLGASRRFAIRHNATRARTDIVLAHGDLLIMSGASQRDYQHSVPKTARPIGARLNLTFRTVHAI